MGFLINQPLILRKLGLWHTFAVQTQQNTQCQLYSEDNLQNWLPLFQFSNQDTEINNIFSPK